MPPADQLHLFLTAVQAWPRLSRRWSCGAVAGSARPACGRCVSWPRLFAAGWITPGGVFRRSTSLRIGVGPVRTAGDARGGCERCDVPGLGSGVLGYGSDDCRGWWAVALAWAAPGGRLAGQGHVRADLGWLSVDDMECLQVFAGVVTDVVIVAVWAVGNALW